jgi:demethylmenaquinone methyltransferase/2-methoxy-6-polyprenyl-1,4-benzoquinol methylase
MSGPDRERALRQYREVAGDYDRRVRIGEVYRRRALEKLDPRPSNAVVDAACGTGLSFPGLEARVGPRG